MSLHSIARTRNKYVKSNRSHVYSNNNNKYVICMLRVRARVNEKSPLRGPGGVGLAGRISRKMICCVLPQQQILADPRNKFHPTAARYRVPNCSVRIAYDIRQCCVVQTYYCVVRSSHVDDAYVIIILQHRRLSVPLSCTHCLACWFLMFARTDIAIHGPDGTIALRLTHYTYTPRVLSVMAIVPIIVHDLSPYTRILITATVPCAARQCNI